MYVYVWGRVEQCTAAREHTGGGVVIFAPDEGRARFLASTQPGCEIPIEQAPDHVRACDDGPEIIYIMPDIGCCG